MACAAPFTILFWLVSTELLEGETTLVPTPSINTAANYLRLKHRKDGLHSASCAERVATDVRLHSHTQELEYFCMLQSTQQFHKCLCAVSDARQNLVNV